MSGTVGGADGGQGACEENYNNKARTQCTVTFPFLSHSKPVFLFSCLAGDKVKSGKGRSVKGAANTTTAPQCTLTNHSLTLAASLFILRLWRVSSVRLLVYSWLVFLSPLRECRPDRRVCQEAGKITQLLIPSCIT